MARSVGRALRETGQALDRAGMRAQNDFSFKEKCASFIPSNLLKLPSNICVLLLFSVCRHRQIMNLMDKQPFASNDSFVAPNAALIGDVSVGDRSSVWYGCVIRGKLAEDPIKYNKIQCLQVTRTRLK
jgi:hypothetical protein